MTFFVPNVPSSPLWDCVVHFESRFSTCSTTHPKFDNTCTFASCTWLNMLSEVLLFRTSSTDKSWCEFYFTFCIKQLDNAADKHVQESVALSTRCVVLQPGLDGRVCSSACNWLTAHRVETSPHGVRERGPWQDHFIKINLEAYGYFYSVFPIMPSCRRGVPHMSEVARRM